MPTRVLETVLTGRDLLSPMLGKAGASVAEFNAKVAGSNTKAAATAVEGAGVQSGASGKVVAANARNAESATASAASQTRAHAKAAESASLSAKAQQSASNALARSNGLLGTSLTPLTAGLGAVALGLGYAAYSAMGFDKSMSQVQAATQASASTMGDLRGAALQAGADTKYSSTEAAAGITELAKAGVSTTDILNGGLIGALNLAAAGQLDVADAAEIGATALSVFGLAGDKMSHVADLLAAGAGKAQGSVGDLSMALNQSALVARNTGLSVETTTGALALFAYNGLKGSDAGTSFKTMLQALNPRSEQAAQLMDQLGLNAYDAQGNFVGLSAYAEQLKTSLGKMSQEQRNSALQTIFGSDAVRAATILYQSGAAGVEQWTNKVNDAGFASRQAAQLQDNLSGDLEKLGGSVETFFTTVGQGAQGPLRALVQALTEVVNAGGNVLAFWSSLPGPVQAALVAALAWAVAGDKILGVMRPMSGMLGSMRGAWSSFGQAMGYARQNGDGLGTVLKSVGSYAGGATLNGIKALGRAIGPELGIAAAVYTVGQLVDGFQMLGGASDEAKAAAKGLADALTLTDEVADRHTIRKVMEDTDGLVEALGKAGVSSQDAVNGLLGQADATDRVSTAIQNYINLHPGGIHSDEATSALMAKNAYEELATGYGTAAGNARYFSDSAAGTATATDATGTAAATAAPSVQDYTTALQGASDAASQAKTDTDLFKLSLDILTGKTVDLATVEAAFYEATSKADGAMKGMSGSVLDAAGHLNVQSESGRKAQGVLFGVRDAGNLLIATMIQQGATTAQVNAKDAELRKSFINTATQMGISAAGANRLADQILGIPGSRKTTITADTSQATSAVITLQSHINGLQGKTITITTRTVNVDGTVSASHNFASLNATGGVVHAYAGGGIEPMSSRIAKIVPPGTPRIIGDRVVNDEFFIPDNNDARSLAIGAEYLRRHPMLLGAFNPASAASIAGPAAPLPMPAVAASMPGYGIAAAPQVTVQFFVDGQEFRGLAKTVVDGRLEDLYRKKTFR